MKFWSLLVVSLGAWVQPALAQSDRQPTAGGSELEGFIFKIRDVSLGIIDYVLGIAGGVVIIMVIYGGIQMITGQKDAGKKTVTAAVIGAVIIVLSYAIYALFRSCLAASCK